MEVKKNKKERWYMIKLRLWANIVNIIIVFSTMVFMLGIIFGFISEGLVREILPVILPFSIIYIIYNLYALYKTHIKKINTSLETSMKRNDDDERGKDD